MGLKTFSLFLVALFFSTTFPVARAQALEGPPTMVRINGALCFDNHYRGQPLLTLRERGAIEKFAKIHKLSWERNCLWKEYVRGNYPPIEVPSSFLDIAGGEIVVDAPMSTTEIREILFLLAAIIVVFILGGIATRDT